MEKITTEFITLQQFLKMNDLIFSGGEAKYFVKENDCGAASSGRRKKR